MDANRKLGFAWVALCATLAIHTFDEASTGFLSVYNPTVLELRRRISFFPMPTFGYREWLLGLIAGTLVLLVLSPLMFRGARWIRPLAYIFGAIMFANGIGHTAGTIFGRTVASVRFPRPMPGFYSAPLLFICSTYLLIQLRRTSKPELGSRRALGAAR